MPATSHVRPLTEVLIEEHGLFRRALALFGNYAERVVSRKRYDPRMARAFLCFFRDFVDKRHHDKEEQILFPWMSTHGLLPASDPLVVLRSEHDLGRDLRRDLDCAARRLLDSPAEPAARVRFHGLALRFTELFTAHMNKEEQVLFPLVKQLAAHNGGELRSAGGLPVRGVAWIRTLEADRARLHPLLSLHGLGTLEGFQRLCQGSLTNGVGADKERSAPDARLRTRRGARVRGRGAASR